MAAAAGSTDLEKLNGMKVSELKAILDGRGVSYRDCVEKSDIVRRVIESGGIPAAPAKPAGPATGVYRREETVGGLHSVVIDNVRKDYDLAMIMSHGYGANEQDLADIGEQLLEVLGSEVKIRFVFPRAINTLSYGSYAWWPIDMEALMMARMSGAEVMRDLPPEMPTARAALHNVVTDTLRETGLPFNRLILGGFSQGSMLSTDYVLRAAENPAALCIFSGTLLGAAEWTKLAPSRAGMPVLQQHGTRDPILPYKDAVKLKDLLDNAGVGPVDWVSFDGPHTIHPKAVERFLALLRRLKPAGASL